MKKQIEAIFFDLFSTLISVSKAAGDQGSYTADILGIDRTAWNNACFSDHHDICAPSDQIAIIQKLAHSLDPSIPLSRIQEAAAARQWRFDHALCNIEEEILHVLGKLKQRGIRLGLISNASTDEVRAWSDSPLAELFETAHFSCHCGIKKPQPGIYQLVLRQMGLTPEQALFVGDGRSQEHRGASSVGIKSLLVTYFIDSDSSDTDLNHRREGTSGEIAHIRDLFCHI